MRETEESRSESILQRLRKLKSLFTRERKTEPSSEDLAKEWFLLLDSVGPQGQFPFKTIYEGDHVDLEELSEFSPLFLRVEVEVQFDPGQSMFATDTDKASGWKKRDQNEYTWFVLFKQNEELKLYSPAQYRGPDNTGFHFKIFDAHGASPTMHKFDVIECSPKSLSFSVEEALYNLLNLNPSQLGRDQRFPGVKVDLIKIGQTMKSAARKPTEMEQRVWSGQLGRLVPQGSNA